MKYRSLAEHEIARPGDTEGGAGSLAGFENMGGPRPRGLKPVVALSDRLKTALQSALDPFDGPEEELGISAAASDRRLPVLKKPKARGNGSAFSRSRTEELGAAGTRRRATCRTGRSDRPHVFGQQIRGRPPLRHRPPPERCARGPEAVPDRHHPQACGVGRDGCVFGHRSGVDREAAAVQIEQHGAAALERHLCRCETRTGTPATKESCIATRCRSSSVVPSSVCTRAHISR